MICPKCGKEFPDEMMFCKYCGMYTQGEHAAPPNGQTVTQDVSGTIQKTNPFYEKTDSVTDAVQTDVRSKKVTSKDIKFFLAIIAVCVLIFLFKVISGFDFQSKNALYPKIIGNNINNINENSRIDVSAKEPDTIYRDPSNNNALFSDISVINDVYYALDINERAVTFNVKDGEVENVTEIPELSGFRNIGRFYVSKEYYFIYADKSVYSVDRKDGTVKQSFYTDIKRDETTFTENGKFCTIDWNGQTGLYSLYVAPAGAIDQEPEKYYTFMDTISGTVQCQIFSGSSDIVYVYLWREQYNSDSDASYVNKIYKIDLSKNDTNNIKGVDIQDNKKSYFTCDGENVFYCSYMGDDANKATIGMLNIDTGERTDLKEIDKYIYDMTVYPKNKGKFSVFVGNSKEPNEIITVP